MKSKISYWTKNAVKNCVMLVIIAFVYSIVFLLVGDGWDNSSSLREIVTKTQVGFYYQVMAMVMILIWVESIFPSTINLVLSVGSTRKSAYKGICAYSVISLIMITVFHALILIMQGIDIINVVQASFGMLGAELIGLGVGILAASLQMKKNGGKVFAMFGLNLAGMLLSIAAMICSGASFVAMYSKSEFPHSEIWCIVSIVLGIILCVTGFVKMKKTLSTHEVRV